MPWRFLVIVFLCVAVVTTSLPVIDWLRRPTGSSFTGYSYESVGDIFFYLTLIEQAKNGALLFRNFMTPETHDPVLLNPLFLALGWVARLLHLTPLMAWHVGRVVLVFPFFLILYRFLQQIGLNKRLTDISFLFVVFSGGVYLRNHEASTFLSLLFSPLSILSLTTTLLFFSLTLRHLRERWSTVRVLLLVALGVLQAVTHPYILTVWLLVPLVILFMRILRRPEKLGASVVKALPYVVVGASSFLYFILYVARAPVLVNWANGAVNLPWWPSQTLSFFGVLLPLAVVGFWKFRRALATNPMLGLLCIWLVVNFILSRSPYLYAGRLMLTLHLPLAVFAAIGTMVIWERVKGRVSLIVAFVFMLSLALPDNLRHLQENVSATYTYNHFRYLSEADTRGFQWIRTHTPADAVILHAPSWDTLVAQQSYRQVFCTAGPITAHFPRGIFECLAIYAGLYDSERFLKVIQKVDVDYMIIADQDRQSGHAEADRFENPDYRVQYAFNFHPGMYQYLKQVYDQEGFQIYEVINEEQP